MRLENFVIKCKFVFSWVRSFLPGDSSFSNGTEWLLNTVHERDYVIVTDSLAEFEVVESIDGLKIKKTYMHNINGKRA